MNIAYRVGDLCGNGGSVGEPWYWQNDAIDPRGRTGKFRFSFGNMRSPSRMPRSTFAESKPPSPSAASIKSPKGPSRKELMNAIDNTITDGVIISRCLGRTRNLVRRGVCHHVAAVGRNPRAPVRVLSADSVGGECHAIRALSAKKIPIESVKTSLQNPN